MALDDLLATLAADAAAEIEVIEHTADESVEVIRERARREVDQLRQERLDRARQRLEAELRREEARTAAQSRHQLLEARERVLRRVFEEAACILRRRAGEEHGWIEKAVSAALPFLPPGPARLRCPESSTLARQDPLPAALAASRIELVPEAGDGFVLEDEKGTMAVDLTPESRLATQEPALAIELLHLLESPRWNPSGAT